MGVKYGHGYTGATHITKMSFVKKTLSDVSMSHEQLLKSLRTVLE